MTAKQGEDLPNSLTGLTRALRERSLSPVEVVVTLLERIEAEDKVLNAFITVTGESALREAERAEREIVAGRYRGPLHGVPVGLKDLIYTRGIRTTMGSTFFKDHVPDHSAPVALRLEEAGTLLIGKTNTHEFAYGPTGDRSYFGPTRNPHDTTRISGGSSGGSGAAVAADLLYAALGSDTGGSIRIPAALCGVVGMKPTFGRVSKRGVFPPLLDTGPRRPPHPHRRGQRAPPERRRLPRPRRSLLRKQTRRGLRPRPAPRRSGRRDRRP